MPDSLKAADVESIQEAIAVLDEAGFDIEGIGKSRPVSDGILFDLTVAKTAQHGGEAEASPDSIEEKLDEVHETVADSSDGNSEAAVREFGDRVEAATEAADQSDTGDETEGDGDSVHIDNGEGDDGDSLPDPTEAGDPFHGESDDVREDRSHAEIPDTLADALATDTDDEAISSMADVEAHIAQALADGQREFTGAGIAEHVDTNGTWAARILNQLDDADEAPLTVEREHADEPNVTTVYHVEVATTANEDDSDGADEDDAVQQDDGDDDDEDYVWCGACGKRFQTVEYVRGHHKREGHPGEPIPMGNDPAEETGIEDATGPGDEALFEGGPTVADVQDLVDGDVDELGDLAEELDISYGSARLLARKAGVLNDGIRDDIERMGVGSDD